MGERTFICIYIYLIPEKESVKKHTQNSICLVVASLSTLFYVLIWVFTFFTVCNCKTKKQY